MSKQRNPEYDNRDLLFVHTCEKCSRAWRCSFKTSPEGPEAVCQQLIAGGTYHCESCIRHKVGGGCHFECVFFHAKPVLPQEVRTVLPMTADRDKRLRTTYYTKDTGKWETNRRDSNQNEPNV